MNDPFHHSKYSLQHAERRLVEFEKEVNAGNIDPLSTRVLNKYLAVRRAVMRIEDEARKIGLFV